MIAIPFALVLAVTAAPTPETRWPLPRTGVGFLAELSFGDDVARVLPLAGSAPPSFGVILQLEWAPHDLASRFDEATLVRHPELRSEISKPQRFDAIVDSLDAARALMLRVSVPPPVRPAADGSSFHPSHEDMLRLIEDRATKYGDRVVAWIVRLPAAGPERAEVRLARIEEVTRTIRGKDPGARIVLEIGDAEAAAPPGLVDGYLVHSSRSGGLRNDVAVPVHHDPDVVVWTYGSNHLGGPTDAWDRMLGLRDGDVPFGVNFSLWQGNMGSPDLDLQWPKEMADVFAAYARAFPPDSVRVDGGSRAPANVPAHPLTSPAPSDARVRFELPPRSYGRWTAHRSARDGRTRVILRSEWVGWPRSTGTSVQPQSCSGGPTPEPPPTTLQETWVRLDPGWTSASLIDPLGTRSGPLDLRCSDAKCRVLVPRISRPVVIELVPAK